jgi:hypothetical protein
MASDGASSPRDELKAKDLGKLLWVCGHNGLANFAPSSSLMLLVQVLITVWLRFIGLMEQKQFLSGNFTISGLS